MNFLHSRWVAHCLGLATPNSSTPLSGITSDSRTVRPGSLFVALAGERSDGHQFLPEVAKAGAGAVVHRKDVPPPPGPLSFPVDDTLVAWRKLAASWRSEFQIPVLAVAGSAGKTTSKEFLAAIMGGKFNNVLKTQASQNGFQGIPSTLLGLSAQNEVAVIEVGIDEIGAMKQHLDIVQPSAGLLSSIGPEHLEKLIDLETVEAEEGLLFKHLAAKGKAARMAVNADDAAIVRQAKIHKGAEVLSYSLHSRGEVNGRIETSEGQWTLIVDAWNASFHCPLPGEHNVQNLLGALTLSKMFGLSNEEMKAGLEKFSPPPGRGEVHQWRGTKVLLDAYNANPASVVAALKTARSMSQGGRLWVCLGDMLELGTDEIELHRQLAPAIKDSGAGAVLLYGKRMGHLADELRKQNFGGLLSVEDSHEALAQKIAREIKASDSLLIKGSRGMRMETVWSALQQLP
jgi:UDP-N-acetylmuramoyl-tripeptide--D-alanyl-D-alanine ligase